MQARPRSALGGQAQQIPQEVANAIQKIRTTLTAVKLNELGERGNEEKLADLLVQAKEIGEQCAGQGLGKTQMMNIMGRVQGLGHTPTMADIRLLQAHLAYQAAKESRLEILVLALDPWFGEINKQWGGMKGRKEEEREEWARKVFGSFIRFIESVVAFHRYREAKRTREGGAQQ